MVVTILLSTSGGTNVKRFLRLACLCFVAFSVVLGCSAPGAGSPTYTLSGSVATPQGATVGNGTYVYLKLVANGGASSAAALYWTRSAFSGGSASYSISGILGGTYTGWVFIDMNGDAHDASTAMPDTDDYAIQNGQQIAISGDETQNVSQDGWVQQP